MAHLIILLYGIIEVEEKFSRFAFRQSKGAEAIKAIH